MDRNNPNLNPKQRELVERLEKIRQQRSEQPVGQDQSDRQENEASREQQEKNRRSNRNRNKQKRTTTRPQKRNMSSHRSRSDSKRPPSRSEEIFRQRNIRQESQYSSFSNVEQPSRYEDKPRSQRKNKPNNNWIKQLSDGNQLADAIILNEVLSKPVALKKRYR